MVLSNKLFESNGSSFISGIGLDGDGFRVAIGIGKFDATHLTGHKGECTSVRLLFADNSTGNRGSPITASHFITKADSWPDKEPAFCAWADCRDIESSGANSGLAPEPGQGQGWFRRYLPSF